MSTQAPSRDPLIEPRAEDRLRDSILDALIAAGRPVTVAELAEAIGQRPDAARRLLRALEAEGRAHPRARLPGGAAADEVWAPVPTMKEVH